MLNIVIPMAGRGSRFLRTNYLEPKPLININGQPMIKWVVDNIKPRIDCKFIFVCQKAHIERYDLEKIFSSCTDNYVVVPVNYYTEGAACSVLLASDYIDNEEPLMIVNSDQYIDYDINDYLNKIGSYDGFIMTMKAENDKWSYIKYVGPEVILVKEKEIVSDEATVGIYNYKHGADFVKYARQMICKNLRVNNEFYVAPVYNEFINAGLNVSHFCIGSDKDVMHGLGTPEDLQVFINLCRSF